MRTSVAIAVVPALALACATVPAGPSDIELVAVRRTVVVPAGAAMQSLGPGCVLSLVEVGSPFCTSRGPCVDDDTRWLHVTRAGEACGPDEPQWSIRPLGHERVAEIFAWRTGSNIAYVRGECGLYEVDAAVDLAGGGRAAHAQLDLELPGTAPECPEDPGFEQ